MNCMQLNILRILSILGGKSKLGKILRAYREIYNPSCKNTTMKRRIIWALESLKNNGLVDYSNKYSHKVYSLSSRGYLESKIISRELDRERMRIENMGNQIYLRRIKGET